MISFSAFLIASFKAGLSCNLKPFLNQCTATVMIVDDTITLTNLNSKCNNYWRTQVLLVENQSIIDSLLKL